MLYKHKTDREKTVRHGTISASFSLAWSITVYPASHVPHLRRAGHGAQFPHQQFSRAVHRRRRVTLAGKRIRAPEAGLGRGNGGGGGLLVHRHAACALPYYLSGNYLSYLDCCFDVMSGFTTTGLTLIQDMDHLSNGINMWRHLLTFVGGQGMVVLALTFLVKGTNGAYKMYVGEGKDERLMPNAVSTARYIWLISLIYLVVGTLVLWIAGITGRPAGGPRVPARAVDIHVGMEHGRLRAHVPEHPLLPQRRSMRSSPWCSSSSARSTSRCITRY